MKLTMTYELAYAAATDTGNDSMRRAGRIKWDIVDYGLACRTFAKLYPSSIVKFHRVPNKFNT